MSHLGKNNIFNVTYFLLLSAKHFSPFITFVTATMSDEFIALQLLSSYFLN